MTSHESPEVYYSSLEEQYLAREGVDLRRSLESPALAYRELIFAFTTAHGLVVRLGVDAAASAVGNGHGSIYETSPEHELREWLLVPFDVADPGRWGQYVARAHEYAHWVVANRRGAPVAD